MQCLAVLRSKLEDGVRASGGTIIGEASPRLASIGAVALPGASNAALLVQFDLAGIAVSAGSACSSGKMQASAVLSAMDVPDDVAGGVLRVSFGSATTESDIDAFLAEWRRIAERSARAA
jgi:cysteine desulfurase